MYGQNWAKANRMWHTALRNHPRWVSETFNIFFRIWCKTLDVNLWIQSSTYQLQGSYTVSLVSIAPGRVKTETTTVRNGGS